MPYKISFARKQDENQLRQIFLDAEMDLVGDIEDHITIAKNGKICGGALLYQVNIDLYHLLTIAVSQDGRSRGLGSRLLKKILNRPWSCCRDAVNVDQQHYRVTTVSRGRSRKFYLNNGMQECANDSLQAPFDQQCCSCSEVTVCQACALDYRTGKRTLARHPQKGIPHGH